MVTGTLLKGINIDFSLYKIFLLHWVILIICSTRKIMPITNFVFVVLVVILILPSNTGFIFVLKYANGVGFFIYNKVQTFFFLYLRHTCLMYMQSKAAKHVSLQDNTDALKSLQKYTFLGLINCSFQYDFLKYITTMFSSCI